MKNLKLVAGTFATIFFASILSGARAADTNSAAATAPKPDNLKTCPVSGDKLNGDMGKPYVFVYQGQEVKLCCPDCKAQFDKDPQKYLKKIQDANK